MIKVHIAHVHWTDASSMSVFEYVTHTSRFKSENGAHTPGFLSDLLYLWLILVFYHSPVTTCKGGPLEGIFLHGHRSCLMTLNIDLHILEFYKFLKLTKKIYFQPILYIQYI